MISKLQRIRKIGLAILLIFLMSGVLLFEGSIQALPCCSCYDEGVYCAEMGMTWVSGYPRACSACGGDDPAHSHSCHMVVCY